MKFQPFPSDLFKGPHLKMSLFGYWFWQEPESAPIPPFSFRCDMALQALGRWQFSVLHNYTAVLMAGFKALIFLTDCLFYIRRYVCFSWAVFACCFFRHDFDTFQEVWLGNLVSYRTCSSVFLPLSSFHFIFMSHVNIHYSCALTVSSRLQCLLPSASEGSYDLIFYQQDMSVQNRIQDIWNSTNTAQNPASKSKCSQMNDWWQFWSYNAWTKSLCRCLLIGEINWQPRL